MDADLADPRGTSIAAARLDALLELARSSRDRPTPVVLQAVAEAIERVVGYRSMAVNVYRPAWDDYEVVLVHGSDASQDALLHTTNSRERWRDVLVPEIETVPGAYFVPGERAMDWARFKEMPTYRGPMTSAAPAEHAWGPEDGLFVELRSPLGLLGVLSLDDPASGQRPTLADLEMVVAVANHASLALESALVSAAAARHRERLSALLEISSALTAQTTVDGVVEQIRARAVPCLGFEDVEVYLSRGSVLEACSPSSEPAIVRALLHELIERRDAGDVALLGPDELVPRRHGSSRNGRGPQAWNDHRLVAPLRSGGEIVGALLFDDPCDRLLPEPEQLQTARLLADHVGAALETIDRQSLLEHLAMHDPLTGVRNRRDLLETVSTLATRAGGVSVLMCDIDHFKQVNDGHGHRAGDDVLERFGALLRRLSRAEDIPVRAGGEEFCLLLPRRNAIDAMAVAERLRAAVPAAMRAVVPGVTVSIGIATSRPGGHDATTLLAEADRALYEAKTSGRNRCCAA